eukprot:GHUV01032479.1.p1 GENE.GHUV01032479.1~~GHUV01032479.1.p1  ORF type:complete len:140 (-),score=28.61 GHUV01032479.1:176-595(-)
MTDLAWRWKAVMVENSRVSSAVVPCNHQQPQVGHMQTLHVTQNKDPPAATHLTLSLSQFGATLAKQTSPNTCCCSLRAPPFAAAAGSCCSTGLYSSCPLSFISFAATTCLASPSIPSTCEKLQCRRMQLHHLRVKLCCS